LKGDVAIAPEAGPVWPMKKWAHYDRLKRELESSGLTVNVLPVRPTLLEHLCDVRNHRCLVSGDSLPMHLALGTQTRCVTLFTCTSPWEIHDYGLQRKLFRHGSRNFSTSGDMTAGDYSHRRGGSACCSPWPDVALVS